MKTFDNLQDFRVFCEKHPLLETIWRQTVIHALRLLEIEYGLASKINSGLKLQPEEKNSLHIQRQTFMECQTSLAAKCKDVGVQMPTFNADAIGAIYR